MNTVAPELSIVIPVHNGAEWITEQLDGLALSLAEGPSAEILVVDNRCTDDTIGVVGRWSDQTGIPVRVVPANERAGEPYARNVGFRAARTDFIAYCDADDVVAPTWTSAMLKMLKSADYVTGPLDTHRLNSPEAADMRGQALFRELPTLHGVVPFAHGCNMGFRRSVLEQTGGFDETYLIGCDIEMAIRLWRADVTLMWSPEALVHYRLRSTPRAVYRQARAYGRSRLRFDALVPELEPTHGATKQLRRLAWLMRHLPDLRSLEGRFKWSWVSGQVVGEVEGLLRRQQP